MTDSDGEPAASGRAPPPPVSRQRTYIVENAGILDDDTKKAVLRLVMMEVGQIADTGGKAIVGPDGEKATRTVVLENGTTGEVSIHLDHIDDEDVILHIYNIVSNRRASLNEPANVGKR